MRAVLDTNVVVSAFLSPTDTPARILDLLAQQAFVLVVSQSILDEYVRALCYEKVQARHGMSEAEVADVMGGLGATSVLVAPSESHHFVERDAADDMFFECAIAGGADYIVSGDAGVLAVREVRGIVAVSPAVFVEIVKLQDQ